MEAVGGVAKIENKLDSRTVLTHISSHSSYKLRSRLSYGISTHQILNLHVYVFSLYNII